MVTSRTRLLLLLLLPLSVSNIEFTDQTVKEEEDAVLLCGKVPPQTQCEFTDWTYKKDFSTIIGLFRRGQTTGEGAGTLLSDCSLHLPRVTKDQRGTYICKQNGKETNYNLLYVASLSQRVENDRVTFTCSVTSPGSCPQTLKWFNNNKQVTTEHKDLKISQSDSGCDLSVSFNDPSPPSEFYQTLKCQVKQNHPTKILTLVPRPPDEKTTEPPTTSRPGTSTSATAAPTFSTDISTQVKVQDQTNSPSPFTRLLVSVVVPVVVCVALLLICVALVLWRKLSGGGVTDGDTIVRDPDVAYASVQFKQKDSNPRFRVEDEDVTYSAVRNPETCSSQKPEDGVTYVTADFNNVKKKKRRESRESRNDDVTYSSVRAFSPECDPNVLYASVKQNKPRAK